MWPFKRDKKVTIRIPACLEFPSHCSDSPVYVRGDVVAVQPVFGKDFQSVLLFDGGQHAIVGCSVEESRSRLGWFVRNGPTV